MSSSSTLTLDPTTFFQSLFTTESSQQDGKNLNLSSSSSSEEDDEEMDLITSSRLLGKGVDEDSAAAVSGAKSSRWFQLADQEDSDRVVTRFDRLGIVSKSAVGADEELSEMEQTKKEKAEKERDQERRIRQRSQFFETYSDDEEGARLVVSHKKRRLDELDASINKIEELKEEQDWIQITEEIKELDNKTIKKMLKMKQDFQRPPKKYIKFMVDLKDEVVDLNRDRKYVKALIPSQKKALSKLQGPLRNAPYLKKFQKMTNEYINNKDNYNIEEDFGLEEEEEALRRAREKLNMDDERSEAKTDSGPSKWLASDSESSDEESDEDDYEGKSKWLAGSDDETSSDEEEELRNKKEKKQRQGYKKKRRERSVEEEQFKLTDGQIEDKVVELRASRGKRLLTAQEIIDMLKTFYKHAVSDEVVIQVLTELLSTIIDKYASSEVHMSIEELNQCYEYASTVFSIIESHPETRFVEAKANEEIKKQKNVIHITGNMCGLVEQLDTQYVKAFKFANPHTQEYVLRLKQQYQFLNMAERAYNYYEKQDSKSELARIAYRLFHRLYYRRPSDHVELLKSQRAQIPEDNRAAKEIVSSDLTETLSRLSILVYGNSTDDLINKTILMHIFHLAMKDQYTEARDLLIMSHISDSISDANSRKGSKSRGRSRINVDPELQVLFNRCIAQLGLCAFRCGQIRDTYNTLRDMISANQSLRDILAQVVRYNKENQAVEKRERERFVPYHMHLNIELVESAYIISAILLEIPYSKQMSLDIKKRFHSIALKRYFRFAEDRLYNAPPENTREHLYAASTYLSEGKWKQCFDMLKVLRIWDICENKERVLEMVKHNVKVEALRTYLFAYLKYYGNISLERMQTQFDLSYNNVYSTVCKMIANQELHGSIDQITKTVVYNQDEPNELHRLAFHLINRARQVETHNADLADIGFNDVNANYYIRGNYHVDHYSALRKKYAV